jgi:hypothetical protein
MDNEKITNNQTVGEQTKAETSATASVVNVSDHSNSKEESSKDESSKDEQLRKDLMVLLESTDARTVFAHPGLRALVTTISWFVMGYEIPPGRGFFTASFLFSLSLAFDYGKFMPKTPFRIFTRNFGAIWGAVWAVISFMGIVGALNIISSSTHQLVIQIKYAVFNGYSFPFLWLFLPLGLTIVVTLMDWVSESSEFEKLVLAKRELNKDSLANATV